MNATTSSPAQRCSGAQAWAGAAGAAPQAGDFCKKPPLSLRGECEETFSPTAHSPGCLCVCLEVRPHNPWPATERVFAAAQPSQRPRRSRWHPPRRDRGQRRACLRAPPVHVQVPRNSSRGQVQVTTAYAGELGYELVLVLPLVHYWHSQGVPLRTLGPLGSAPFYPFSPNHTEARTPRVQGPRLGEGTGALGSRQLSCSSSR